MPTQGNAWESYPNHEPALKGRNIDCAALSGLGRCLPSNPGRCPGLACLRAFGPPIELVSNPYKLPPPATRPRRKWPSDFSITFCAVLEKLRNLGLRQPDGFVLKPALNARPPILRLVEDDCGKGSSLMAQSLGVQAQ